MAEFASRGVGNAALTTGIIGAASWLFNGNLGNILGGNNADGPIVTRYEMALTQENSILKAQADVDTKLLKVYETINSQINTLNSKVDSNAAAQAVINCGFNSNIGILQTQMNSILGMTKMVIPSTNICTATDTTTTA